MKTPAAFTTTSTTSTISATAQSAAVIPNTVIAFASSIALLVTFFALLVISVTAAAKTSAETPLELQKSSGYSLGPGDRIAITVFGEDDLSIEFELDGSGAINYPMLGELQVAGKSAVEIEKTITAGLKGPYLVNPDVSVAIIAYRAIFLNGEVANPGGYPYQPGLTLEKSIALAGGFTERAGRTKIYVRRARDGKTKRVRVRLNDPVFPGDIIVVKQSFF